MFWQIICFLAVLNLSVSAGFFHFPSLNESIERYIQHKVRLKEARMFFRIFFSKFLCQSFFEEISSSLCVCGRETLGNDGLIPAMH